MRIALITNVVAPYRTPLFEQIANAPDCELLVVYEAEGEPNRPWSGHGPLGFDHVFLNSRTVDLRRLVPDAFVHLPRRPLSAIRRFAPDVVIPGGAGIWSSPTNIAALAGGRFSGRRTAISGEAFPRGRPGWALASYWGSWGVAEWWESPARPKPTLPRRLAEPWVKSFVRHGDAWIAYGSRAATEVVRLGADPARTVVAPNAVPRRTGPPRAGTPNAPPRFLFVGQLVRRKGVETLLDAFQRVGAGELWVVGEGPLRPLVELASATNPQIRYFGHQQPRQLDQLYRDADVLVLPSWYEVWGLVVNEAMGFGLPVLITDQVGAGDDLVDHDVNGLVVRAASVEALAEGMLRIAEWPDEKVTAAAAHSSQLLSHWTIERAAEQVIRACSMAVEHRRR